MLRAGSVPSSPHNFTVLETKAHLGPNLGLGSTLMFLIIDTDNYDFLLGLDSLIKICVVMDLENGLIQIRQGPKNNVQILPLNMVNML